MSSKELSTSEAIEKNSKEEWYTKLKNIPSIREFELEDWKDWAEYHSKSQKEFKNV